MTSSRGNAPVEVGPVVEVVKLTDWMVRALKYVECHPNITCSIVGAMLTGRRSAFGHQTSAREGGRTLMALRKRGLVRDSATDDGLLRLWNLTEKGRQVSATVRAEVES